MREIVYDCPNCLSHYVLWDESMTPLSIEKENNLVEMVRKQIDEVGDCKKCTRKDPDIRTTLEMDGIFSLEDIRNRFFVMVPCLDCLQFTKQDTREKFKPCEHCGSENHDPFSTDWSSIRTWSKKKKAKIPKSRKINA